MDLYSIPPSRQFKIAMKNHVKNITIVHGYIDMIKYGAIIFLEKQITIVNINCFETILW